MIKKLSVILFLIYTISVNITSSVSAQSTSNTTSSTGLGCGGGLGPIAEILCGNKSNEVVGDQLNRIISVLIGVMTGVAAIWFIFQFITAGYQWISSGGDKDQLSKARDKITNSLIGLIIVVGAWIIIGIIGTILGLSILNPGQILLDLGK